MIGAAVLSRRGGAPGVGPDNPSHGHDIGRRSGEGY